MSVRPRRGARRSAGADPRPSRPQAAGDAGQRVVQELPSPGSRAQEVNGGDGDQVARRDDAPHQEEDASRAQLAQAVDAGERPHDREQHERKRQTHEDADPNGVDERHEQRRAHPRHETHDDRARGEGDGVVDRSRRVLEARRERLGQHEAAPGDEREEDAGRQHGAEDDARAAFAPPAPLPPRVQPEGGRRQDLQDQDAGDLDPGGRVLGRGAHGRDPLRRPRRDLVAAADDDLSAGDAREHALDGPPRRRPPLRGQRRVVGQVGPQRGREEGRDLRPVALRERRLGQLRRNRGLRPGSVLDLARLAALRLAPRRLVADLDAAGARLRREIAMVDDAHLVQVQADPDEAILELLREPPFGERSEGLVSDRQRERVAELGRDFPARAGLRGDRAGALEGAPELLLEARARQRIVVVDRQDLVRGLRAAARGDVGVGHDEIARSDHVAGRHGSGRGRRVAERQRRREGERRDQDVGRGPEERAEPGLLLPGGSRRRRRPLEGNRPAPGGRLVRHGSPQRPSAGGSGDRRVVRPSADSEGRVVPPRFPEAEAETPAAAASRSRSSAS